MGASWVQATITSLWLLAVSSKVNASPLNAKLIALTPTSPFRPRRWVGKIIPSTSKIKITNLNLQKRPISVVADNIEVRNIKNVNIKINNRIRFKLLYDRTSSLSKKIKLEQYRRNLKK